MKTYCINCGTKHIEESYPKKYSKCLTEAYQNPPPVIVVLVPVIGEGVLLIKRGINPGSGVWALPGGYMELGETMEESGAREVIQLLKIKFQTSRLKKPLILY